MGETKNVSETEGSRSPIEGSSGSLDETWSLRGTEGSQRPTESSSGSSDGDPSSIGRYRIIRRIGQGGFGRVYLAHDDDLDRPVAVKVPNPERITHPDDVEAFFIEARVLAKLDHPHIVPVFDVGRTEDRLCFVVSKLVEGSDLAVRMGQARLSFRDSAELVAAVALALHYAHTRGLVHRDIKPANILIDFSGKPCVADFGLALKDEDFGTGGGLDGTPAYMSPEQARGEGHRVDGRSDIFSLGVVFYELLVGRRPFIARAKDKDEGYNELLELIAASEARPPRQVDDTIPKELERICQKALAKRTSERYSTAKDMAEDLRLFLQSTEGAVSPVAPVVPMSIPPGSNLEFAPLSPTSRQSDSFHRPIKIVPRGLRSFDLHDADFFLELLPGPRDRDGLPESIQFWKRRIEQIDPDLTFKVGLIYGPSGCGKSSLVKAGLLPRLAKHVLTVYIEATPEETEARLLKGLRKVCPELPPGLGLADSLASLRRGRILPPERKVLLVLDQFEQWLFASRGEQNTELVTALRQCDGEHIQAVVMVRDDFWMAATRFMRDLEIRLLEGENSGAVDLFDLDHARKVLTAYGRAFGRLPENASEVSRDQKDFLKDSVNGLAEEGKIICVRLALYAEMMKGKPWAPSTLKEVGGTKGVGVTFLEENFSASTAPPEHRFHQKAARAVLKSLLPESGTDIKGQMRSRQELLEASGYANRPRDFDDLIHILDPELRLITPTDPEGSSSEGQTTTRPGERYYQLSHDYLVHSLRDWLTRKQRETRRGRAELRLSERSASWNAKPENRHLPSALEWANIRMLTKMRDWTEPERTMMKRARRLHGLRSLGLAAMAALLAALGLNVWNRVVDANQATAARGLVQQIVSADTAKVPDIIRAIKTSDRRWTDPKLRQIGADASENSKEKLHASLALLPVEPGQVEYLYRRLLNANPGELTVIRKALDGHQAELVEKLWSVLENTQASPEQRFCAACALAGYVPGATEERWLSASGFITERLLQSVINNPSDYPPLLETLRPIRKRLLATLSATFRDGQRTDTERSFATNILTDYAGDQPAMLADLLMDAGTKAYSALFPGVQGREAECVPFFQAEIGKRAVHEWNDPSRDASWAELNSTAKSQIESAGGLVGERFAFCQTMPLGEFLTTALGLRMSGFRPIRFRPYADGQVVRVAAVWKQDRRNWKIAHDQTTDQISKLVDLNRNEGFVPVDVAGYVGTGGDGKPADRVAVIWAEKAGSDDDARMVASIAASELEKVHGSFKNARMAPMALSAFRGTDGRMSYCGIWHKSTAADSAVFRTDLGDMQVPDELAQHAAITLIDLSVSVAAAPATTRDRNLDRVYAAVWTGDLGFEATPVFGLDPGDHLARCRELESQGYRMVSLSVVRTSPEKPPVTASVWHRPVESEEAKDRLAERQARAAVALIRLGRANGVWTLLRHSADPRLRSFMTNWFNLLGADPKLITTELDRLDSAGREASTSVGRGSPDPAQGPDRSSSASGAAADAGRPSVPGRAGSGYPRPTLDNTMDAILFHPETSIRRALILALGTYGTTGLSPGEREPLIARLLALYESDPDAGIHGAAAWTLRQWQQQAKLEEIDSRLRGKEKGDRRWLVNSQGQTFALIDGPVEFRMGSPPTEPDRIAANELRHRRIIPRRFAIAAKEVTVEEYQEFVKENPGADHAINDKYSPDPRGPMNGVSWYHAVAYCNWLSRKEGLSECYEPKAQGQYSEGMKIRADALGRTGYRLPTEAEWEYACRAGAGTSRYFGVKVDLLGKYAWYQITSQDHTWPCGSLPPNDLGLFDMLGNVFEWCQERSHFYRPDRAGTMLDDMTTQETVDVDTRLLRGGAFGNHPANVRSASRDRNAPSSRDTISGFRPARTYD